MSGVIQWVTDATEVLVTFASPLCLPRVSLVLRLVSLLGVKMVACSPQSNLLSHQCPGRERSLVLGTSVRRVRKLFYLSLSQPPLEYLWPRTSQEPIHQPETYPVSATLPVT